MSYNYQKANESLQGRNHESRKIDNNTYLIRKGNDIALRLHKTDVVTYKPNGDIVLDSGGWRTPTTKDRIAEGLPAGIRIYQEKGVWFIRAGDWNDVNAPTVVFKDGMVLRYEQTGMTTQGAGEATPKKDDKLKRAAKKYAILCADSVPLPKPSSGDCWYCHMSTEDDRSLGDASKSNEHIISHMEEGYVVPSLVYRALKESGGSQIAWSTAFGEPFMPDIAKKQIANSVYKYVTKRLGFSGGRLGY